MHGTIDIKVPGRVWDDYLDPGTTRMQGELGLPLPSSRHLGAGWLFTYHNVPRGEALELADYLDSRAAMLLSQGIDDPYDLLEKATRDTHRRAIKLAEQIRKELG